MSTLKSIVMLSLLSLSLFVTEADARSSGHAVGRVTHTQGDVVELQFFDVAPEVGAIYDLRRQRAHSPKSVQPKRSVAVAQVRVTEVTDAKLAKAKVVKGSAWRRDRVYGLADAQ